MRKLEMAIVIAVAFMLTTCMSACKTPPVTQADATKAGQVLNDPKASAADKSAAGRTLEHWKTQTKPATPVK